MENRNARKRGYGISAMAGAAVAALFALAACMEGAQPTKVETERNTLATALAVPPVNFTDVQVTAGLTRPTMMAMAPDGRIFVSEQDGNIRIVKNGALLPTPFANLPATGVGERGVLGIAFDPSFASNKFVYVYYTRTVGPNNRLSRLTANGDVAIAGSEVVLADFPILGPSNRNGGGLHFGADGKLYVGVGDNNSTTNSQSLATPLGKILRFNKDGSIPSDNPFFLTATGLGKAIWAYGLRNPWEFSFQGGTGRLFANDVGQDKFEEVNDIVAGKNYGWFPGEGVTGNPAFKDPYHAYDRSQGGCSITGGAFYSPSVNAFPAEYSGDYFFTDYCHGRIMRIDMPGTAVSTFANNAGMVVNLQAGNDGAIYYLVRSTSTAGVLRKITYTGNVAPAITLQPANKTVEAGGTAGFTVAASGTAPLAYQWQRNQANIAGATTPALSFANVQGADDGARFRCRVTNAVGTATSTEAVLKVHQTLQAENALLSGAVVSTERAGYIGTGYADYVNNSNDFVEFTVTSAAGSKSLGFRYGLGAAAGRPLRVSVNGAVVNASLAFPPTGSWTTWLTVTQTVTLVAGVNKVRLTAIGSSGPNLDQMFVH